MCPFTRTAYTHFVKPSIKITACDLSVFLRCKTAHMKNCVSKKPAESTGLQQENKSRSRTSPAFSFKDSLLMNAR